MGGSLSGLHLLQGEAAPAQVEPAGLLESCKAGWGAGRDVGAASHVPEGSRPSGEVTPCLSLTFSSPALPSSFPVNPAGTFLPFSAPPPTLPTGKVALGLGGCDPVGQVTMNDSASPLPSQPSIDAATE